MEDAISTGSPAAVRALLQDLDEASLTAHLTRCYGGRPNRGIMDYGMQPAVPNRRGLTRQTTPLLHAAFTGSADMFYTILGAAYDNLSAQQVEVALMAKERRGRSVVAMAVASKTTAMLEVALTALDKELRSDQVMALLKAGEESGDGENILHWVANSGSISMFEAAVSALRKRFSPTQVKGLVRARTDPAALIGLPSGWTLLHSAAEVGSMACFEAALALVKEELGMAELKEMIVPTSDSPRYDSILKAAAVGGGSKTLFEALIAAMEQCSSPGQVMEISTLAGENSGNVLQAAVESGAMHAFQGALETLEKHLPPTIQNEKIREMMMWSISDHRATILHLAALSGSRTLFDTVMAALENYLRPDQVKAIMRSTRGSEKPSDIRTYSEGDCWTILHAAAASGNEETVRAVSAAVRRSLGPTQATAMVASCDLVHGTIIHTASRSGSSSVFEAVLDEMTEAGLPADKVNKFLASNPKGLVSTVLAKAAASGSIEMWRTAVHVVDQRLAPDEVQKVWAADGHSSVLSAAASSGVSEMWQIVEAELRHRLELRREVWDLIMDTGGAVSCLDPATLRAVMTSAAAMLSGPEDIGKLDNLVSRGVCEWWFEVEHRGGELGWSLEVLASLLRHPIVLPHDPFIRVSRVRSDKWMKTCILGTIAFADNPFVPGMALSTALANATDSAPAGERRKLESLWRKVEALMLEVFERLPRTIDGFDGGMAGCAAVFEPEVSRQDAKGNCGPLWMALQDRRHIRRVCTTPLLMDFLLRRFNHGLPDLMSRSGSSFVEVAFMGSGGTGESLPAEQFYQASWKRSEKGHRFMDRCLLLDFRDKILGPLGQPTVLRGTKDLLKGSIRDFLLSPRMMLQGMQMDVYPDCRTFLPGAQFVAAGLAGRLDQFYRVPLMRMRFDLVVYLGMLAVFSSVVLLHNDGPLTPGEIMFALHVVAGILTELREMKRDFTFYLTDQWNLLDLAGLGLLASGAIVRVCAVDTPWGRTLYALSAPFVFARLLFWAQTHRAQGPMIQVIFSMTAELVRFGAVILVVMFGFAMAFQTIFREETTFGETWLVLFKALLGDVEFFDSFSGGEHDIEATILLVTYLVVISIMLLNLLIAVLSTSHARIQGAQELEYKTSKLCLIERYRSVVAEHLLPPPFNLVQLFVALPFALLHRSWGAVACIRAREFVGRLIFWISMGSVGVVGGALLWMASVVYTPFVWVRDYSFSQSKGLTVRFKASRFALLVAWCLVGAPLYLFAFWLATPLKWMGLQPLRWLWDPCERPPDLPGWDVRMSVNDMRTKPRQGLTVRQLQEYLDEPMSDPLVRQDEVTKPTTVRHMKELRDRLEKRMDGVEKLAATSDNNFSELKRSHAAIGRQLDDVREMVKALSASTR